MDLHSIESVLMPRTRAELPAWSAGTAVLGGGTWLFSEPQPHLRRLIDLTAMGWESLTVDGEGLHVAGTCTIAALSRFTPPADWRAGDLIGQCCDALLGSFKVWNAATVGGNICLALPAGPIIALAAALGGIATVWRPDGGERRCRWWIWFWASAARRWPTARSCAACCCRAPRCDSAARSAASR